MKYKFLPLEFPKSSMLHAMAMQFYSLTFTKKNIPSNWHGAILGKNFVKNGQFSEKEISNYKSQNLSSTRFKLVIRKSDILKKEKFEIRRLIFRDAVDWLNTISGKYMFTEDMIFF